MERRERVVQGRARTAAKALRKSGYLTGEESPEELSKEFFEEVAAHFLADVLHLADYHGARLDWPSLQAILRQSKEAYDDDNRRG